MKPSRRLLHIYWPFLLAIVIEFIAILVSRIVSDRFYSSSLAQQDCSATPSQLPDILTISGVIIAIFGIVRVFKIAKRTPHIVASIVLLIVVILGALLAYFFLDFLAGLCF